jgi:DNA polymerase (family 10)
MALDKSTHFVVSSDSHFVSALDWVEFGIRTARRGWATRADILNTRSLSELTPLLRRHRGAA